MRGLLSVVALIVLAVSTVVAQDSVVADADHIKLVFENDQVQVLRWSYKPGDKSPIHEYPANVIIALTDQDAKNTVNDRQWQNNGCPFHGWRGGLEGAN
jgi:hypothetical protein